MGMVLTEEQQLLRDSAAEFIKTRAPVTQLRALRDTADATGYSADLWREMAEMGWTGIMIPEAYGGLGFGFQGLGLVLEETGRTLTASPLVSTVLTGSAALLLGGSEAQKQRLLPLVVAGERVITLAIDERPHHAPSGVTTKAQPADGGYVIHGEKTFVLDGHMADTFIVSARTSGGETDEAGITLFIVDARAPGVDVYRTQMVDSRNAARVRFNGVRLGADDVLGSVNGGFALLDRVLDYGRIGLAAEMLGTAQAAFDMTLDYLKTRTQFGQTIGQFQSLQHRAAVMFCELELARSVVMEALSAVDEESNQIALLASLAKARLSDVCHLVARETVQMHGGIGMTDDHDAGLYLKRCAVAEQTFGAAAFHRSRYASLEGY